MCSCMLNQHRLLCPCGRTMSGLSRLSGLSRTMSGLQAMHHWGLHQARRCMHSWLAAIQRQVAVQQAKGRALQWYAAQLQRKAVLALYDCVLLMRERAHLVAVCLARSIFRRLCWAFDSWCAHRKTPTFLEVRLSPISGCRRPIYGQSYMRLFAMHVCDGAAGKAHACSPLSCTDASQSLLPAGISSQHTTCHFAASWTLSAGGLRPNACGRRCRHGMTGPACTRCWPVPLSNACSSDICDGLCAHGGAALASRLRSVFSQIGHPSTITLPCTVA